MSSKHLTSEKLVKNFARCNDWEERYLYLIELGEKLPFYPPEKLTEHHLVSGCQSKVWLDFGFNGDSRTVRFNATSDAAIVRGLLALLRVVYDERSIEQVVTFDIENWFEQLELKTHLTPGRTQGLEAIVAQIEGHLKSMQQGII